MVPVSETMYELRVRGAISGRALSMFEEMDIRSDTLLSGVVQDQAALHGLLERIRDLGLELVEVHQVPDHHAAGGSPARNEGEGHAFH
jgi:hypothetical protein